MLKTRHNPPAATPSGAREDPRLRVAFKVIIVLATIAVALALGLFWRWRGPGAVPAANFKPAPIENLIQQKFPYIDFTTIYPGLSPTEIDRLQRDCLGMRYAYAPLVEFAPLPVAGKFLNILPAGYRLGRTAAPWPPAQGELVVFVFGGSTAMGFGVPDGQTVVSALEDELGRQYPGRIVRCYNFGRGYYFSSQERALFESLLVQGLVPHVALFLDGLNDFAYFDGVPQLAPDLFRFTAPDQSWPERAEPSSDAEREQVVNRVVERYARNVRLIEAAAKVYGVSAVFVGQPVPFLDFPGTLKVYPFQSTYREHRLCAWGYDRFKAAGQTGRFGARFLWCGDAFAATEGLMYADSIHYSPAGSVALAKCIADRIVEARLLP